MRHLFSPQLRGLPREHPPDWDKRWRIVRNAAAALLFITLAWQSYRLPDKVANAVGNATASRLDPMLANMNGALGNINASSGAAKTLIEMLQRDYYDPANPTAGWYWDVTAMIESSTTASRSSEEFVEDLRAAILGGKDTKGVMHEGVMPAVEGLLGSLKSTSDHLRDDLDRLTGDTSGALKPLKAALQNVANLTDDLDKQLKDGGGVAGTFRQLDLAVANVNVLLEDPNIQKILKDSSKITGSLADSAETLEIAVRPCREKANQLKLILGKLVGLVKFVHAF